MSTIFAACLIIAISDGDTLTARCNENEPMKIRLAEIDAPEKAQAFGQRSKQSLAEMCFKQSAEVNVQTTDRYHRSVARVTCNGVDVNAEQIRRGMAWVYDKYCKDRSFYKLQSEAQQEQRGLWTESNPTPPWKWRHSKSL